MAKAPFVTQRGGVGGVVYQGGKFGPIARERVVPTNPQTIRQQNQRNILGTTATEWRGLTDAQRLAWRAFGAMLGTGLSAFNVYTKVNATRLTCDQAKIEDPPALPPAFGIMLQESLVADASAQTVVLHNVEDTVAPDKFMIFAATPQSPGQEAKPSFRFIKAVDGFTDAADIDISEDYIKKFGEIQEGQRIQTRIAPIKDGIRGVPLTSTTIVVA